MKYVPFALAVAGLAAGLTLASRQEARAIAAFSREYNTECITCHAPFPRRNAFGEAFEKNGYVWPGRERTQAPKGQEALWLSGLPESIPLSASVWADVNYNSEPDRAGDEDKIEPDVLLSLQAGGNIRDQLGFFAHDLTSAGGEAFGMFRRVARTPLNVKFGRFTPKTTLWKPDQAFTLTPLAPLNFIVDKGPGDTTVEGGNPDPLSKARDAVELNAVLGHRWFLAAGVADRNNQDGMEFFGHASYRVGGTDFLGEEPEIDFDVESVWDYLALTLGAYVNYGTIESETFDTNYWRVGAEAEAAYKGFTFLASGVVAEDDDIDGTGTDVDTVVFALEADYYFAPEYLFSVRFENEDVGNARSGIVKRFVGQGSYFWNQNVALRLEGTYARSEEGEDKNSATAWLRIDVHI